MNRVVSTTIIVLLQTNSFQLVISTDATDHFIILNYGKLYITASGTVRKCTWHVHRPATLIMTYHVYTFVHNKWFYKICRKTNI